VPSISSRFSAVYKAVARHNLLFFSLFSFLTVPFVEACFKYAASLLLFAFLLLSVQPVVIYSFIVYTSSALLENRAKLECLSHVMLALTGRTYI
jgi:hypothetical protein